MKITKIAQVCKRCGQAVIMDTDDGTQWISCGGAMYPLLGMPELDTETLPQAFSFTDGDKKKLLIERRNMLSAFDTKEYCGKGTDLPQYSFHLKLKTRCMTHTQRRRRALI